MLSSTKYKKYMCKTDAHTQRNPNCAVLQERLLADEEIEGKRFVYPEIKY